MQIWRRTRISTDRPQRNLLILLLATCETALERFGRPDVQVDDRLLRDLERVIEGAQTELKALDG
jgi:hypothetical protein